MTYWTKSRSFVVGAMLAAGVVELVGNKDAALIASAIALFCAGTFAGRIMERHDASQAEREQ